MDKLLRHAVQVYMYLFLPADSSPLPESQDSLRPEVSCNEAKENLSISQRNIVRKEGKRFNRRGKEKNKNVN